MRVRMAASGIDMLCEKNTAAFSLCADTGPGIIVRSPVADRPMQYLTLIHTIRRCWPSCRRPSTTG